VKMSDYASTMLMAVPTTNFIIERGAGMDGVSPVGTSDIAGLTPVARAFFSPVAAWPRRLQLFLRCLQIGFALFELPLVHETFMQRIVLGWHHVGIPDPDSNRRIRTFTTETL